MKTIKKNDIESNTVNTSSNNQNEYISNDINNTIYNSTSNQYFQLKLKYDTLFQTIGQKIRDISNKNSQINILNNKVLVLEQEINNLNTKIYNYESEIKHLTNNKELLYNENKILINQRNELSDVINKYNTSNIQISNEDKDFKLNLIISEQQATISKLKLDNSYYIYLNESNKKKYDFEINQNKELYTKQIDIYKNSINELTQRLNTYKLNEDISPDDNKLIKQYINMDLFINKIDDLYIALQKLELDNISLSSTNNILTLQNNQYKFDLNKKDSKILELNRDYNDLKERFKSAMIDAKRKNDIILSNLIQENIDVKKKNDNIKKNLNNKNNTIKYNRNRIRNLSLKVNDLYNEIFNLKKNNK